MRCPVRIEGAGPVARRLPRERQHDSHRPRGGRSHGAPHSKRAAGSGPLAVNDPQSVLRKAMSADFGADHAVGESPRRAGRRLPAGPGARDARPRPRGRRSRGQNRRLVTRPRRRPSAVAHAPAAPPAPRWETLGAAGSARSPPLLRSGRGAVSARRSADTPRRPCPRLRRGSGGSTKALATVEKARRIRSAQRRPAGRAATRASDSADPSPDSAAAARQPAALLRGAGAAGGVAG